MPSGWQAVRKFLQTSEAGLRIGSFDLVVVHVDADIEALVVGASARDEGDERGGLDALCRHVKGWIGGEVPANVVIVLPRATIEAWLVPLCTHHKNVEALEDRAAVLADNGIDKKRMAYRRLVATLPALMDDRRRRAALPELDRFIGKVESRHREVLRGARGG